jgi:hypothetical protein
MGGGWGGGSGALGFKVTRLRALGKKGGGGMLMDLVNSPRRRFEAFEEWAMLRKWCSRTMDASCVDAFDPLEIVLL